MKATLSQRALLRLALLRQNRGHQIFDSESKFTELSNALASEYSALGSSAPSWLAWLIQNLPMILAMIEQLLGG